MAKIQNKDVTTLIYIIALFIFGVMFCCSLSMGVEAVSWIVGAILIVTAVILIASAYVENKSLTTIDGLLGAVIAAFGVLFIVRKLAWIIVQYIPYLLIFIGALLILDSILFIMFRGKKNYLVCGIELAIGCVSLTLGLLLIFVDDFAEYASIVFGIILIAVSIYQLLLFFGGQNKRTSTRK